jgi:Fe-Mn family superoxide dismutase
MLRERIAARAAARGATRGRDGGAILAIESPSRSAETTMPVYTLPDLPYDFSALEPAISGKIVELHHGKHHAAYVKNANRALEQLNEARARDDFDGIAALERTFAFNLSGHVLHSIYWQNLAPKAGGAPTGELARALDRDFGGFGKFQAQMNAVATSILGSGWAALVFEPFAQRLLITQIYDHQSNLTQSGVPLLVIDAWEHAYYLQYQDRKVDYCRSIWSLWNWTDVAQRHDAARKSGQPLALKVS